MYTRIGYMIFFWSRWKYWHTGNIKFKWKHNRRCII